MIPRSESPVRKAAYIAATSTGAVAIAVGLGMVGACALPLVVWIGWAPVAALLLGYASHLVGDSATKSGLKLRYPDKNRYHLLPVGWRITTGSQAEDVVMALLLLPAVLFFFRQMWM